MSFVVGKGQEVITGNKYIQPIDFHLLADIFWYAVRERKRFEAEERAILDEAVRTQIVQSVVIERARDFGLIALGTPAVEHGGTLVVAVIHGLGVHAGGIDNLLTQAVVEEYRQGQIFPLQHPK